MKNIIFKDKVNFVFPLEVFNTSCAFYLTKCVFFKFLYKSIFSCMVFDSIKFITNNYYTLLRIEKFIKKNNTKSRKDLILTTKKIRQQKGLGKARLGSAKSPLMRGGAILFGPKSLKLRIYLNKKNSKLNFLYIFINKRTQISFILFLPFYHKFCSLLYYLKKQQRIKGYSLNKTLYILKNFTRIKNFEKNYLSSIYKVTLNDFLNTEYISFLV